MFLEGTRLNHCVPRANAVMVSGDHCPIVVYVSLLRGSLEGTCVRVPARNVSPSGFGA